MYILTVHFVSYLCGNVCQSQSGAFICFNYFRFPGQAGDANFEPSVIINQPNLSKLEHFSFISLIGEIKL
jgi:hypothetical protein